MSIPSTLNCDKGFTVVELLVASFLSSLLLAAALGGILSLEGLYARDVNRVRLQQSLRGTHNFIGLYIRQAGVRIPASVPAIEIIDGTSGAPDQLILRQNLIDEVLTVCQDIAAGSSGPIHLSDVSGPPACIYGGQATALSRWESYRLAAGGTVRAYIFNLATKQGEFFDYTDESDTGSSMRLIPGPGGFTNEYLAINSAVFIMQEWRFELSQVPGNEGVLEVIENQDVANPRRVVFGLSNFQVQARLTDNTVLDTFDATSSWQNLAAIRIDTSAEGVSRGETFTEVLQTEYFPRNILSL